MTRKTVFTLDDDHRGRRTQIRAPQEIGNRLLKDARLASERRLRPGLFDGRSKSLNGCGSLLVIHTSDLPAITSDYKPFVDACSTNIL